MAQRRFSYRAFTSFILAWTFLILIVSGSVLYVAPPGRIANWTRWQLMILTKDQWQAVHTLTAIVFLLGGLFHLLKFNWKVFGAYLKKKGQTGWQFRREMIFSSVMFLAVLAGTVYKLPPFVSVTDAAESIRNSWDDAEKAPPIPHMEQMTLAEVAGNLGIPPDTAAERLRHKGLEARPEASLQELGMRYGKSPQEVYAMLSTSVAVSNEASGSGTGLGLKTVAQISSELGMTLESALDRLREQDLHAAGEDTLRTIALAHKMKPFEVYDLLKKQRFTAETSKTK